MNQVNFDKNIEDLFIKDGIPFKLAKSPTTSKTELVDRVVVEQVRSSQSEQDKEDKAKIKTTIIDHSRLAPAKNVSFLVDSGVRKTLISELEWKKVQTKKERQNLRLKKCRTIFRPYGTQEYLPIIRKSKCRP